MSYLGHRDSTDVSLLGDDVLKSAERSDACFSLHARFAKATDQLDLKLYSAVESAACWRSG